jgi:hypothetical protein
MFKHDAPAILALLLLPCLLAAGCGHDEGASGDLPRQNVFLEAQGCLADNPDAEDAGTVSYTAAAPFDLSLMEVTLEVVRGEMDLVIGADKPPSDYFAFGRGTGTRKILVGSESREPAGGRPWFVELASPFEVEEECEDQDDPDWRLTVRRSTAIEGGVLLVQDGQVPACTPGSCTPETVQIEVPADALSMEIVLESRGGGDADLLVGLGGERESLVSLNPGPGYDVVVIDQALLVPLREQSLFIFLESWQQTTEYRLEVAYVAGEVGAPETPPEEEASPEVGP